MKYHNITKADMLNGSGLRVVLWVSGCSHHCKGCQNPITWNPNCGLEFDDAARDEIYTELKNDWCSGITLSGGDPLYHANRHEIMKLVKEIKKRFPNKTIWCYTGWTWDELQEQKLEDKDLAFILENIDILCEGRYIENERNIGKRWVGSNNQRIIDVQKSIINHELNIAEV